MTAQMLKNTVYFDHNKRLGAVKLLAFIICLIYLFIFNYIFQGVAVPISHTLIFYASGFSIQNIIYCLFCLAAC